MGLLDKLFGKKKAADPRNDSTLIRCFDEFGRELFVTREQWRTRVLPGALKSNQENPEQLAGIVISALQDGFCADVLDSAKHLHALDPASALATCIYGIALTQTHRLDDAERLFRSYLDKEGPDASVLTNLAKVHAARNNTKAVDSTLWRAMETDPNFENGFSWYVALHRERDGEAAEQEVLRRLAEIPRSWRSQLWLARKALETRNPAQAIALYREVLSRAGDSPPADLLMQMSGDLGGHGLLEDLLQLAEPRFVPEIHGLQVGNNLIKANVDLGRIEAAASILNQLYAIKRPDWKESLAFWDTAIAQSAHRGGAPADEGSRDS